MSNLLTQIMEQKRKELIRQMGNISVEKLMVTLPAFPPRKHLFKRSIAQAENMGIIAEIKFASPTNGKLGEQSELIERAKQYEEAGATAISLVTEKYFFNGHTDFIQKIK